MNREFTIRYKSKDGEICVETVTDPEYIDMLANIGEVAVDGEVYQNVIRVYGGELQ